MNKKKPWLNMMVDDVKQTASEWLKEVAVPIKETEEELLWQLEVLEKRCDAYEGMLAAAEDHRMEVKTKLAIVRELHRRGKP